MWGFARKKGERSEALEHLALHLDIYFHKKLILLFLVFSS